MMFSHFILAVALPALVSAQQFTPTDQTTWDYPANGAGVTVPFPSEIAKLTGQTDWPERWVTPPFTPNMQSEFNPSATTILADIIYPPNSYSTLLLSLSNVDFVQTFDDGPTNVTSILLDYLDSVSQRNTFFEIGTCVADNYLLTQREYASGHEIGVHTWSHPDLTTLTAEQVYAELAWTIYVIYAAIGQTPKYFRPPYGAINNQVRQVAAQFNLTVSIRFMT
jgi:peptidoglycan/xylan/chitin deacetylase (PgdA/CDA1 family)